MSSGAGLIFARKAFPAVAIPSRNEDRVRETVIRPATDDVAQVEEQWAGTPYGAYSS